MILTYSTEQFNLLHMRIFIVVNKQNEDLRK